MLDVSHQISSVQRQVGSRVLAAGEARIVNLSQEYRASVEDLWDACTSPDRIPRWFLPITGDLRVGGHYQLEGNAGGTIERCEPPHGFAATWEFGGEVSWIEVRLSAPRDGTARLELEHVAHVDDERWAQFGPGAVGLGWDLSLLGLAQHLSTPDTAVDPAESAAWMASGPGREFLTRCGELWCEASIAAGTDAGAARAAAARTTAAYTGIPAPAPES